MEAINTVQPGGEELLPPQKRIRLPTQRLECPSRDEQKALEQALKNSVKDQVREPSLSSVPFGPTFHPTVEEFSGDPLVYIEKIRHQAEKYGEYSYIIYTHITYTSHYIFEKIPFNPADKPILCGILIHPSLSIICPLTRFLYCSVSSYRYLQNCSSKR